MLTVVAKSLRNSLPYIQSWRVLKRRQCGFFKAFHFISRVTLQIKIHKLCVFRVSEALRDHVCGCIYILLHIG